MSAGSPKVTGVVVADELTYMGLPNRFYSTTSKSSVLEYMLDALWTVFDRTLIVSSTDPPLDIMERIDFLGTRVTMDRSGDVMSMMLSAVELVETPAVLVVSGDRPLLKPSVLFMVAYNMGNFECVVPRWRDKRIDPLLASYRTTSLEESLKKGRLHGSLVDLIGGLNDILYISVENELNMVDPELHSFLRLKDPGGKEKILRVLNFKGSSEGG